MTKIKPTVRFLFYIITLFGVYFYDLYTDAASSRDMERYFTTAALCIIAEYLYKKNMKSLFWAVILDRAIFLFIVFYPLLKTLILPELLPELKLVARVLFSYNLMFYVFAVNLAVFWYLRHGKAPKLRTMALPPLIVLVLSLGLSGDTLFAKTVAKHCGYWLLWLGVVNAIYYFWLNMKHHFIERKRHLLMVMYLLYLSSMLFLGTYEIRFLNTFSLTSFIYPLLLSVVVLLLLRTEKQVMYDSINSIFKSILTGASLIIVFYYQDVDILRYQAMFLTSLFLIDFYINHMTKNRTLSI